MEKLSSSLLRVQGFYTLITSTFVFIVIDRFVSNSIDTVPIRVFSLILICVSIVFIDGTRHNKPEPFLYYFPFVFSAGMLSLDLYTVLNKTLPKIYLADVFPQGIFLLGWVQIFFKAFRLRKQEKKNITKPDLTLSGLNKSDTHAQVLTTSRTVNESEQEKNIEGQS